MTTSSFVPLVLDSVARACGRSPDDLSTDRRFRDQGVDSLTAVRIVNELSQQLGRPLRATLLWEYPTVQCLAQFLADEKRAPTLELDARSAQLQSTHEPIAIVGMGCRFPAGIDSPDALWAALVSGVS